MKGTIIQCLRGGKLKPCSKCKKEYPATVEYFHRNKYRKDGLHNQCKGCRKSLNREPRKKQKSRRETHIKEEVIGITVKDLKRYKLGQVYKIETKHRAEIIKFKGKMIQDTERFITLRNKRGIVESFLKIDFMKGCSKIKEVN